MVAGPRCGHGADLPLFTLHGSSVQAVPSNLTRLPAIHVHYPSPSPSTGSPSIILDVYFHADLSLLIYSTASQDRTQYLHRRRLGGSSRACHTYVIVTYVAFAYIRLNLAKAPPFQSLSSH
ncbi:hypothetical protein ARMSODRAFT_967217 [Armillaria solidipes]|uniref:Uncharacterized protein n=1 Tax=Armillaria solidipes TaxID=1076256 RepID=A0A2H3AW15_9AGAR|nr:hypothetical protein ARMSODRAFT_967217 [Armillaria solidipes]